MLICFVATDVLTCFKDRAVVHLPDQKQCYEIFHPFTKTTKTEKG